MNKIRIFAIAILMAAGVATIVWAENNNGNPVGSPGKCRDNFQLTITNLGSLPQYGDITVHFHNPNPTVSTTIYRDFNNGHFSERIVGNENNEFWSWMTVIVILGNNEYKAMYCGQQKDLTLTASDFKAGTNWTTNCPDFPW